uniref:uncharacterized protein n=1 Tax=Semicossyphus pulcher TaxID=241346 RepID=UPI0037E9368A
MSLDSDLKLEVISSLFGQNFQPYEKRRGQRTAGSLSVDEFHLHNLTGRRRARAGDTFIDEKDFFDSEFDCDFTNLSDSSQCMRGDELYKRPIGWYRIALKVKGKYPDGDTWLGDKRWRSHSVPGEWPVSYHGTSLKGATGIIRSNYNAGDRAMYGRGIYSTPDIHVAEREEYAKTFTSKTTGKRYKVILQNRINPEKRAICSRLDYWLIRVPKGASAEKERDIVESSIRPYGILIKELDVDDDDDDEAYRGYEEESYVDGDEDDDGNEDNDSNDDGSDDGNATHKCDDDDESDNDNNLSYHIHTQDDDAYYGGNSQDVCNCNIF